MGAPHLQHSIAVQPPRSLNGLFGEPATPPLVPLAFAPTLPGSAFSSLPPAGMLSALGRPGCAFIGGWGRFSLVKSRPPDLSPLPVNLSSGHLVAPLDVPPWFCGLPSFVAKGGLPPPVLFALWPMVLFTPSCETACARPACPSATRSRAGGRDPCPRGAGGAGGKIGKDP